MLNGNPPGAFFYPSLTLMMDSYNLYKPCDAKSNPQGIFFYPSLTLMMDSYNLYKPCDAKRQSSGHIFLSYPHTHDGFL